MTCADDPYAMWNRLYNVGTAFFGGLGTGSKAVANGLTSAGVQTVTLGQCDYQLLEVTEYDEANGYHTSAAIANASGNLLITAGTLGVGCVGSQTTTLGKGVAATLQVLDGATSAKDVATGGLDMYENGVTFENSLQVVTGGVSLYSLKTGQKCFTAGTQVVVEKDAVGQLATKSIEDIREGNEVLSYDAISGTLIKRFIKQSVESQSDHIRHLKIRSENGVVQSIQTTDVHPFWVVTSNPDIGRSARSWVEVDREFIEHGRLPVTENGYYVEASDLLPGDVFLGPNGEHSRLEESYREVCPDGVTVYNITVEDEHNYFVVASSESFAKGAFPLLVHNAILCHGTTKSRAESIFENGPDPHFKEWPGDPTLGQFSFAPAHGPYLQGSPLRYATDKANLFPKEGGPAILFVDVPDSIIRKADVHVGEVIFGPGFGIKELHRAWESLPKVIKEVQ